LAHASETKKGWAIENYRGPSASSSRPSVGAWLANVLIRERGDQVQSMFDLGAALRQAQAQLSKDELRKLHRERRRVIAASWTTQRTWRATAARALVAQSPVAWK